MAERMTPVDDLTGMPLPIIPKLERLPLRHPDIADWHHHFHPRSDPRLKTVGGLALRNSRLQLVAREYHNDGPKRYHKFFDGPPIPESEATQFGMCVLACAGYLPESGIDLRSGEPVVARLDHNQRNLLRSHRRNNFDYRYFRYGYDPIRRFFAKYVLEQNLTEILPQRTIDEFLYSRNPNRRSELGRTIIEAAASSATEHIDPAYDLFRQNQQLHELMPPDPHTLVVYKLGNPKQQEELVLPKLKRQLRQLVAA